MSMPAEAPITIITLHKKARSIVSCALAMSSSATAALVRKREETFCETFALVVWCQCPQVGPGQAKPCRACIQSWLACNVACLHVVHFVLACVRIGDPPFTC
eukprot:363278-Chlamydomonas_euryale.AAC.9